MHIFKLHKIYFELRWQNMNFYKTIDKKVGMILNGIQQSFSNCTID
jgi:hypothetical protein